MNAQLQAFNDNPSQPSVFNKNGQVMTNSRDIAAFFGKRHADVLRSIDNLECSAELRQRNFALAEYQDGQGKTRKSYDLAKDGFWLLVMGFTGKQAAVLREAYIQQFNAMEAALQGHLSGAIHCITNEVKKEIGGIVKNVVIHQINTLVTPRIEAQDTAILTLAEQVRDMMLGTSSRVAALEYVSVRELLIEAKAVQKGRGGLNRKIGSRLRAKALQDTPPAQVRRCPHSNVWLFPRDFADRFMRETGNELVAEHNDRQNGQGRLDLVRNSKGKKVVSITPDKDQ